jgi:PTH1 family peptidyl-tRNA hydrolase
VIKPHTFMNLSGDMVVPFAQYFKIPPQAVLVVADDFNLPLGRIRIRPKGSSGGQNGLDSILNRFGVKDVPRVRLGIGPVPPQYDPADFVLGKFGKKDGDDVEDLLSLAVDAIRSCCEKGISAAMNAHNGDPA